MQTQYATSDTSSCPVSTENSTAIHSELEVVIAYEDFSAGKHAMHVLADLCKGLSEDITFRQLLWSFDLLKDPVWNDLAAREGSDADILIITTSSANPLNPFIEQWVEDVISRKKGTAAAVVALFGCAEDPDAPGSSRLESIRTAAKLAGLDFFAPAPAPRHDLEHAIDRIHRRAETITPLLQEILHRQSSGTMLKAGILAPRTPP